MASLKENKALMYSIVLSGVAIFMLVTGASPQLSDVFSIVEFPYEVSTNFRVIFQKLYPVELMLIFKTFLLLLTMLCNI